MFQPIWPSSCVNILVVGGTAVLVPSCLVLSCSRTYTLVMGRCSCAACTAFSPQNKNFNTWWWPYMPKHVVRPFKEVLKKKVEVIRKVWNSVACNKMLYNIRYVKVTYKLWSSCVSVLLQIFDVQKYFITALPLYFIICYIFSKRPNVSPMQCLRSHSNPHLRFRIEKNA
jgi:hypothetical protein